MDVDMAAVIALGGNLAQDDAGVQGALDAALAHFAAEGLTLLARSRWWRSAAWPDPTQPAYLNGVALVAPSMAPREMLAALMRIEQAFGRRRGEPNAPRTLDLDLIAHGRAVLDEPDLVLPHPRAADRLFVMGPLAEIAPDWRHPVSCETARALAEKACVGADATPT